MSPEYRNELRQLQKVEKKIQRDLRNAKATANREIAKQNRAIARAEKNCSRELEKINRRKSILEGRLS